MQRILISTSQLPLYSTLHSFLMSLCERVVLALMTRLSCKFTYVLLWIPGARPSSHHFTRVVVAEGYSVIRMEEAISFLYEGFAELSGENCMEILSASASLQIPKLKHLCVEYLKTHMTVDSVCTIVASSQRMGLTNLRVFAEHYFYQTTEGVMHSENTIS